MFVRARVCVCARAWVSPFRACLVVVSNKYDVRWDGWVVLMAPFMVVICVVLLDALRHPVPSTGVISVIGRSRSEPDDVAVE